MSSNALVRDMITACRRLYSRGLVANHDGNITVRLSDGHFLATPTSFSKGDVGEADLLTVSADGKIVAGPHKVFSEITWHLAIYRARPDIQCVVHAHPPIAGGMALVGREIGVPGLPEAIVSLGRHILNTKYISPLDQQLSSVVENEAKRCLTQSDAFLSPGNGAWCVGQSVMQAYYRMELVEHIAHQHFVASQMGETQRPAPALIEELLKKRPQTVTDLDQLRSIVRDELKKLVT